MKTDLKIFFKRLYQKALFEEDILSTAAQVAFYFSFALFPLLLFLVSLFGLILESADDFRGELFFYLRQIMPYSAFQLVQDTIQQVTENSSSGKLTFGLLVALWSASAGIDSLRIALNSVYNRDENRSWFKTKLLSLLLTLTLTILITIACGIVFYGWKFLSLVLATISFPVPSPFVLMILQWITILIVLMIIYGLIYNYLPAHDPHKWVWITPGSITGIVLWLSVSYAFRLYLSYFNSYDKTYGSLGAMIILLLWLFLTALVILVGGILNSTLQEMTDPEAAAQSLEKSEIKLEKAKTDRQPEEVEKMKEEHKVTQAELAAENSEKLNDVEPFDKIIKTPGSQISAENSSLKPVKTNMQKAEPLKAVERITNKTASLDKKSVSEFENSTNKQIIGLTAVGAFGFLMGLIFRKKDK